jgi:hypothetical protein
MCVDNVTVFIKNSTYEVRQPQTLHEGENLLTQVEKNLRTLAPPIHSGIVGHVRATMAESWSHPYTAAS